MIAQSDMMNTTGTFMKKLKELMPNIMMLGGGLIGGLLLGMWIVEMNSRIADVPLSRLMAWALGGFYLSAMLQLILHEAGHLAAGLMTGYRFISFRVMNMIWVRQNDRIVRKKFSLAGTGGQCLLEPPGTCDDFPGVFYNMGGVIMNVLTGLIGLGLYYLIPNPVAQMICLEFFGTGILFALINGIPLKTGTVNNDGSNTLEIIRSPAAKAALWKQLKISALQSENLRLKEMPEELFVLPDENDMKYSLCASILVFRMLRLIDEHQFDEAQELMKRAMRTRSVPGVYHSQLVLEHVTMEALKGNTDPALITDDYYKAFRIMRASLCAQRTEFAVQKLIRKDDQKAEELRKKIKSMCRIWPYSAEVRSEMELIALTDRRARTDEYSETGREPDESV